ILGVLITLGNGLVIYLVTCRSRLRNCTGNWFILSLSIADFSVGFLLIPSHVVCSLLLLHCSWHIQVLFYEFLLFVSVGCLCALTLDRYIAITQPLRYRLIMTRTRSLVAIATSWGVPGLLTLSPV
ncbi:predicted protein, partial [Nematostella vectensis]